MFSVSVYGKGGIGKSTVSSNLSFSLSKMGFDVLHVGCDPKHDSTLSLTNGVSIPTFASDTDSGPKIVHADKIGCVECGGPEPGRGCAGKGLEMLFDRISGIDPDYRVCDVLGDVVCGGFSVPARAGNCDGIVIVTSGEFMSLYAANNILRGLTNINPGRCIIGIVMNGRGDEDEAERVRMFADAVSLPIICSLPRSELFSKAESEGKCVSELFPDSVESIMFRSLAKTVSSDPELFEPHPLSEESMISLASGHISEPSHRRSSGKACTFDDYDSERNLTYAEGYVMPACTSHGAADLGMRVSDLAVVLHGPRNCAYLMEYAYRRRIAYSSSERGGYIRPPGIYSTSMDAATAFTDDIGCIREAVEQAASDGY